MHTVDARYRRRLRGIVRDDRERARGEPCRERLRGPALDRYVTTHEHAPRVPLECAGELTVRARGERVDDDEVGPE
jgi:hypothetical protein